MRFHAEAIPIWRSGGWAMIALAVNALVIFAVGWGIAWRLARSGAFARPERAWARWKQDPARARGPLNRILGVAMQCASADAIRRYFESLHMAEFLSFSRDLKLMQVAIGTAPLLGLLGTVTGMLTTFSALAAGSGGEKTMEMIAGGISEALITTETGLVLALSGLIFQYSLSRWHEKFNKIMAHIETQCAQDAHRRASAPVSWEEQTA